MSDTVFISAGPYTWGSSRMRCFWPAKHMNADVVVWNYPQEMELSLHYDTFIFQKYGNPNIQKGLLEHGKKVWLDQCDPMWWFSDQKWMREMFANATGAVFSSDALREDFLNWWGGDYYAYTIPDRVDFSHFTHKKTHHWIDPVRLIWYGVSQNRVALSGALANLSRLIANGHNITLTIFDDRPDVKITEQNDTPILYSTWEVDKEPAMIAGHDIALLPPFPGPWGRVKSNNKAITAYACNVPVTDGMDYKELEKLVVSHEARKQQADLQQTALEMYDVRESAKEWEALQGRGKGEALLA